MAFLKYRGNTITPGTWTASLAANAPLTNLDVDKNFASIDAQKLDLAGGAISGSLSVAGNLSFAGGAANKIVFQSGATNLGYIAAPTTSNTALTWDGSAFVWGPAGGVITDDTTTNATRYLLWDDATTGSATSIGVSSTKLTFNPSTGTLTATNFNSSSDVSLKNDIQLIQSPLATINKIDGVSFTWKENGKKSYGVIAQELEKVLPELVETNEHKTVNYTALIGFLLEAVKELNSRLEKLEN